MPVLNLSVQIPDGQYLKECYEAVRGQLGWGETEYDNNMFRSGALGETGEISSDVDEAVAGVKAVVRGKEVVVPGKLLRNMHRWILGKAMGAQPHVANSNVVHFNAEMVRSLLATDPSEKQHPSVGKLVAWGVAGAGKRLRGRAVADLSMPDVGIDYQQFKEGFSCTIDGIEGVSMSNGYVCIMFPANPLVHFEIGIGAARVKRPQGSNRAFGVCVPGGYVQELVFYARRGGVFSCFFETNIPGKVIGMADNNMGIDYEGRRITIAGELPASVDASRVPDGAGFFAASVAGPARATWSLTNFQFFAIGHLSILATTPLSCTVLVPGGKPATQRFAAAVPGADTDEEQLVLYRSLVETRICAAADGFITPAMARGEYVVPDVEGLRKFTSSFVIDTTEKGANVGYTARFAGVHSTVPGKDPVIYSLGTRLTVPLANL